MLRIALPGGKSLESGVRGLFADAGISIGRKPRSTHLTQEKVIKETIGRQGLVACRREIE
jgi:hypothetical protein